MKYSKPPIIQLLPMKFLPTFLVLSILISSCTWLKEHEYEEDYSNSSTSHFDREYRSRSTKQGPRASFPESGMPNRSGKCYAKCLIQDLYELDSFYVAEYTGSMPSEMSGVEYMTFKISEATTKWERKKADKNCDSKDSLDCLVWCLVDVPEQFESYYVVTDTTNVQDFTEVLVVERIFVEARGYTEWKEIMCAADVTPKLYKSIQEALRNAGHDIEVNGRTSTETKNALVRFQKDNGLPIGALDTETLQLLGVL